MAKKLEKRELKGLGFTATADGGYIIESNKVSRKALDFIVSNYSIKCIGELNSLTEKVTYDKVTYNEVKHIFVSESSTDLFYSDTVGNMWNITRGNKYKLYLYEDQVTVFGVDLNGNYETVLFSETPPVSLNPIVSEIEKLVPLYLLKYGKVTTKNKLREISDALLKYVE